MSKSSSTKVALLIALMAMSVPTFAVTNSLNEFGNETARLATFDNAQGETSFALSISPQVDERKQLASDIVIFVDTSASQTGVFKKDSIATLKYLMSGLTRDDRVKLVAMDIDPVELTSGFVRVDSPEIANAITKLENRVALGSTDMGAMLDSTANQFTGDTKRNRNVIYIGDGISRDGFLKNDQFGNAVSAMTQNHIAFSSYAIGPERNIELLASLSNNTGGNLFIDTDDASAMEKGAKGLAETVHGSVFWPTKSQFPESVNEVYPAQIPPLRTDRDTVLIGSLSDRGDFEIVIEGQINGQAVRMNWPLTTEKSSIDFAFLPKLIDIARQDDGVTLPTLGSAGLREMARVMSDNARELAKMGSQALANGDAESAKILAEAAIASDPNDPVADALSQVATKIGNTGPIQTTIQPPAGPATQQDEDKKEKATQDQGDLILNGNKPTKQEMDDLIKSGRQQSDTLILTEEDRIRVINDRFRARVQYELQRARAEMSDAPGQAVDRMKSMLDVLDQTVDLSAENQIDLRARLESALMESRRRKMEFDDAIALAQQNEAAALEITRTIDEYELNQAEIGMLINRFESLLKEPTVNLKQRVTNYRNAEEVAFQAFELDPEMPEAVAATEMGRIVVNQTLQWQMRRDRQTAFINSLYLAERAGVGLKSPQPLTFPDPAEWARKKALREKYQDVRLDGNENDEKILRALNEPFDAEYDETPFIEVMDELRDNYKINVVLDQSAKDDSLTEDEPVTFKVTGIRLKNALRLMLKEKNATFIVRDETLQVISLDVASDPEYFVRNVYNVGDLVAPRTNFGGMGMGGGMGGGGMGGMGGGGMGGMGGGGMGGGGMGGGGMGGGMFCIQDEVKTSTPVAPKAKEKTTSGRPQPIATPQGSTPTVAWNEYFRNTHPAPSIVRTTVRELMKNNQQDQIIGLINGALQNNQSQPWMYEAMVLAMQISGSPKSDIERALMSAVDLAGDQNDLMIVADYMVKNGMQKRALRLLESIANIESNRPEPYVLGLRAAQQINDIKHIQWAAVGILSQAWPTHKEVVTQAIHAAEAVRVQLKKEGRDSELAEFNSKLDESLYRDCVIKVSWTGDADVDLYVEEPGGTVCCRINPRTTAGGVMMGDTYSASKDQSGEISEYYVLPRGFSGDYRLLVRRVWGEITAGKVTVAVYKHFRTDREECTQRQIELDEKGTLVLFTLNDGRRTDALIDHTIEEKFADQFVMNRAILAQQFEDNYSHRAASGYYRSAPGANPEGWGGNQFAGRGQFIRRPGAVGYQPVISNIFEGATMSVQHATTADRLYVLVSVTPLFQQIRDVQNFNMLGNAGNATGGTTGGGQGGGGGGGNGPGN